MTIRILVYTIILAIVAVLIGASAYYYRFVLGFLLEPNWLSVISALILAVLTAIYVLQTQSMLGEMTQARKAESLPHVREGPGRALALLKKS